MYQKRRDSSRRFFLCQSGILYHVRVLEWNATVLNELGERTTLVVQGSARENSRAATAVILDDD